MLIFTRRIGETVVIGENICCTVLGIKGNKVRFGLDVPAELSVYRHETFLKVMGERVALQAKEQIQSVDFNDPRIALLVHRASVRI